MKKRTEELMRMLEKNQDIVAFVNRNEDEFSIMALPECLCWLLEVYNIKKSEVINRSRLSQIYAYQIFAGTKNPSRNKLIALMFGYGLSVEHGNALLKSAGLSDLYPRDKRDAVIIFSLNHILRIDEVDDLLFELGLEIIST